MTDLSASPSSLPSTKKSSLLALDDRTKRRNASEARFRIYGMIAVAISLLALVFLVTSILSNGLSAFWQTYIVLEVELTEEKLDKNGNRDPADLAKVSTFG